MRDIRNQIVETPWGVYDVLAVQEEDKTAFRCGEGCHRCRNVCEHGIAMREMFEY